MASGERILKLLDDDQALSDLPAPAEPLKTDRLEVRFEGVTFGYTPDKPVLNQVSFTIPAGETWAVVGPTGSGKTSLVNLLLRFYDPDQGRVLINGRDLRCFSRADLARISALVDQEVYLFPGTARENLVVGREGLPEEALGRALAVSGAQAIMDRLPAGLATPLGEGAASLSAGERQLLSLARALAGDPPLLILDEATSSVDPESERLIQEALPRAMAGRTSLVVAHRLSTIRRADNILVMRAGRVVESGSHDELMAAGGLYAHLVKLQELTAQNRAEAE